MKTQSPDDLDRSAELDDVDTSLDFVASEVSKAMGTESFAQEKSDVLSDPLTRCGALSGDLLSRLRTLERRLLTPLDEHELNPADRIGCEKHSPNVVSLQRWREQHDTLTAEAVLCRQVAAEIRSWSPLGSQPASPIDPIARLAATCRELADEMDSWRPLAE